MRLVRGRREGGERFHRMSEGQICKARGFHVLVHTLSLSIRSVGKGKGEERLRERERERERGVWFGVHRTCMRARSCWLAAGAGAGAGAGTLDALFCKAAKRKNVQRLLEVLVGK